MTRRELLGWLAAAAAQAGASIPGNRNVKWALSAALWRYFRPVPFTDILDVMKDTGFIGIRLTGFPGILKTYGISAEQMRVEVDKRGLHVATISFNGPLEAPGQRAKVLTDAREAMKFLAGFGASHLPYSRPAARTCPTPPSARCAPAATRSASWLEKRGSPPACIII